MKKYLLISDMDGTLCRNDEGKTKDIADISRFREKGGIFVINSGRGVNSLLSLTERRRMKYDFLLANTSAVCYTEGEILFSIKVNSKILPSIFKYLQEKNNILFSITKEGFDYFIKTGNETFEMSGLELNISECESISYFNQCSAMFKTESEATLAVTGLNEIFSEHITAFQNGICIDMVSVGHNKAAGIAILAEKLGVEHNNIFTIGDNFNDIPMLDAYRSFVVDSGKEQVKLHAREAVVADIGESIQKIVDNF